MVDIIFANSCEKLDVFKLDDEINSVILNLAHSLRGIEAEDLFLLTLNGDVCENDLTIKRCLGSGPKELILVQKSFIQTEIFFSQMDYQEFDEFPDGIPYPDPFDWDEVSIPISEHRNTLSVIRYNEEELYTCLKTARSQYAQYHTEKANLNKNFEFLRYRNKISNSLLQMCRKFYSQLSEVFKVVNRNFEGIKEEFEKAKKMEMSIVMGGYLEKFENLINGLKTELAAFDKKYLRKFEDELNDKENSLERMVIAYRRIKNEKHITYNNLDEFETILLFNLSACSMYEEFQNDLYRLCDEAYHPKTPIAERLKGQINEIKYIQGNIYNTLEQFGRVTDLNSKLKPDYERLDNIYRNIINFICCFVTNFTFGAKKKLEKLNKKSKALKVTLKNLAGIEIRNLDSMIHQFKTPNPILVINEKIIMSNLLEIRTSLSQFLKDFGNILPAAKYSSFVKDIVSTKELPEIDPDFESVPDKKPEISLQEIHEFYRGSMRSISKTHQNEKEGIKSRISHLENEIEELYGDIKEIFKTQEKNEQVIINTYEEINLMGDDLPSVDSLRKIDMLKVKFLIFKQKGFTQREMKSILQLREENKRLSNPYQTIK